MEMTLGLIFLHNSNSRMKIKKHKHQPNTPFTQVPTITKAKKKSSIPAAFREQIWLRQFGKVFETKCPTPWCKNRITVFDFQSGHNIPESKGGPTTPENLIPICSRCNLSMGDRYTFDEWAAISKESSPLANVSCFSWMCWK